MIELHTPTQAVQWLRERVTGTLQCDSRRIVPGDGFIAWPGAATDGRRHVPAAIGQGAAACLVEREGVEAFGFNSDAIAAYAQQTAAQTDQTTLTLDTIFTYRGQPLNALKV